MLLYPTVAESRHVLHVALFHRSLDETVQTIVVIVHSAGPASVESGTWVKTPTGRVEPGAFAPASDNSERVMLTIEAVDYDARWDAGVKL